MIREENPQFHAICGGFRENVILIKMRTYSFAQKQGMKNLYVKRSLIILGVSTALGQVYAQELSFSDTLFFSSNMQTYTVPDCATNIVITTFGAQGAAGSTLNPNINSGGQAGLGNRVTGMWGDLLPGQTLYVNIGGAAIGAIGGYNGGGNGKATQGQNQSGGGGGATDIRFPTDALEDRIQVSGGGGGGGNAAYHWSMSSFTGGNGGNGGGNGNSLDGMNGEDVIGDSGFLYPGGFGGTSSGPGAASNGCASFLGVAGDAGVGANGGNGGFGTSLSTQNYRANGGGGGGGYLGGNGGGGGSAGTPNCAGNNIGAGGGGSAGTNYFNGEPKDFENGVRTGDGMVVIQYTIVPEDVSLSASIVPCVSQEITLDFSPEGGSFTVLQGNSADLSASGVFMPSEEGTYQIVYSVNDVCTDQIISDTLTLEIVCNSANLTFESIGDLTIYPNPVENNMFIQSSGVLGQVTILDIRGQQVIHAESFSKSLQIDVQYLKAGLYFLHTDAGVKKFIVK